MKRTVCGLVFVLKENTEGAQKEEWEERSAESEDKEEEDKAVRKKEKTNGAVAGRKEGGQLSTRIFDPGAINCSATAWGFLPPEPASSRASKKPGDVKCKHREALYDQHQYRHKRAIKRPSIEEEEEEVDPRVKKFNDRSRAPGLPVCVSVSVWLCM